MGDSIKPMAFYGCGIRAEDARSVRSICGDIYAEDFMTDQGWALFSGFHGQGDNRTTVVAAKGSFRAAPAQSDPWPNSLVLFEGPLLFLGKVTVPELIRQLQEAC